MNIVVLAGKLQNNGKAFGKEKKALRFTVVTKANGNGSTDAPPSFVPCVLFNPDPQVEQLITTNGKDMVVLLQGRINTSSFEKDGQRQYQTEVVVYNSSVTLARQ